ncbi:hypothetical protein MNV49_007986 [Pseudohyphozyma bogoriensis]|nr:hypothetical protein MNV49_007986 [Pseudohyphozyma bogoriensis]
MQSNQPHAELVGSLKALEEEHDRLSADISRALHGLVLNASDRIQALVKLEKFRTERDEVLQLESLAQALLARAELDGVPRARLEGPAAVRHEEEDVEETDERKVQSLLEEERIQLYRLQLAHLRKATLSSDTRLRDLLSRLQDAQSLSTTTAELTRLHLLANRTTVVLAELTVEREKATRGLKEIEERRRRVQALREQAVLDLLLRWDERRRDLRRGDRHYHALGVVEWR